MTRWRASESSAGIERVLTPRRLAQLNACIPGPGIESVRGALIEAARLGREVCANILVTRGWPWPALLAERILAVLDAP